MKEWKLPYTFSRDYALMKSLLDEGYELACYVDNDFLMKIDGGFMLRDICCARKMYDHYNLQVRGRCFFTYEEEFCRYSFAEGMEALNVEFILPNLMEE